MIFLLPLFFLFSGETNAAVPVWFKPWTDPKELVEILRSVPAGKAELAQAEKKDPKLLEHIRSGSVSFTESAVSGTYSGLSGEEKLNHRQMITIRAKLPLSDAVADLSHELRHFIDRRALDIYAPGFDAPSFVRHAIEGEGGELKALAEECNLAWEMEKAQPSFPQHHFCQKYRKSGDSFDVESARKDYYAVGGALPSLDPALKKALPELSARDPVFTSGFSKKPYPISLAEEFTRLHKSSCDNNRWKYKFTATKTNASKRPPTAEVLAERKRLEEFDRLHCRSEKKPK